MLLLCPYAEKCVGRGRTCDNLLKEGRKPCLPGWLCWGRAISSGVLNGDGRCWGATLVVASVSPAQRRLSNRHNLIALLSVKRKFGEFIDLCEMCPTGQFLWRNSAPGTLSDGERLALWLTSECVMTWLSEDEVRGAEPHCLGNSVLAFEKTRDISARRPLA